MTPVRTAPRQRRHAAALLATVLLLAPACAGGPGRQPTSVPLAELVADPERYDGEVVVTRGTVRTDDAPRHHWIEDAVPNRVELVPGDLVAEHVGGEVAVTGRYTFRDDEGRRIEVDDVEVLHESDADPM